MTEKPFKLTLRVVWWMQILQYLFALPFSIGSISFLVSFIKGSSESLLWFFLMGSMAYLGLANGLSTIQITNESVTVTVFYGRFRIYWNEVEEIILNFPFIALIGNDKRVVLSLAFAGKDSKKLIEIFNQQIEQRKILIEENVTPFPITHRNARV